MAPRRVRRATATPTPSATPDVRRSEPLPGIRLVTERMPHVRSASVGLWVGTGSRDEAPEDAGASHLLEHLLFRGTPSRNSQDIAEAFDAVGGEVNAYSEKDHTSYYARVLDADLPMAIDVLCDMFRNALLREEDLEAERKIVLEELAMVLDAPEDRVNDLFTETLWPGHALGRPIIGTATSVGALDRPRLEAFYRRGYVPERLVVSAAGNVDHDAIAALLADRLAGGRAPVLGAPAEPPSVRGPRTAYDTRTTEQVHIVWGGDGLSRHDDDRYALSILNALYGGGMSSRLMLEVRERRALAYAIYSAHSAYVETGVFSVSVGTHESTAATVLDIVRTEARALMDDGPSIAEVERAKGQVKGGLVLSMDDPGGRMVRIGRAELLHGDLPTVDELLERVEAVTRDDVQRVAQRIFGAEGFAMASIGPPPAGSLDDHAEAL